MTTIRDWIGGGGDFSDADQWSDPGANEGNPPASPPGASDTAVFDMGGSVDIAGTVTNLVAQVNSGITLDIATGGYDVTGIAGNIFGLAFNDSGTGGDLTVSGAGVMSTYGIMGAGFGLDVTNSAQFLDTAASTFAGGTTLDVSAGGEFIGSDLTIGGIPSTNDTMIVSHAGVTLDNLFADPSSDGVVELTLSDGTLDAGGTLTLAANTQLTGNGTIGESSGALQVFIDPGAQIVASGGTLEVFGQVNNGNMTIDTDSTLGLSDAVASSVEVWFTADTGALELASPSSFAATLEEFGGSDSIDLDVAVSTSAYNGNTLGGTLTLGLEGGGTANLDFNGDYKLASFRIFPDASGSVITFVPCFAAGTLIRTPAGDVAVEHLAEGDMVLTASGHCRPVTWLGHRHVDCSRHRRKQDVMPVRISPHAFGLGQPRRPLWLSPDHAVFVDGVLIPIRHLVNGTTIAQQDVDEVSYWHVELPQHDVLLAEGLPVESYLDTGNREAIKDGALPQTPPKAEPLETLTFS